MNGDSTGTISFLDVLTCGLGGMIMLFLVLVALNPNFRSRREAAAAVKTSSFAIVVEFSKGGLANGKDAWEFADESDDQWLPNFIESGPGFAVLIADSVPPESITISLNGLLDPSDFSVRQSIGNDVLAMDRENIGTEKVVVWPNPQRTRP